MEKGPLVGEGRIAEIFAWEDEQVIKLFREWCPPDWVAYEARIARLVHATGVAAPPVGEVVQLDGRWGIVYEHVRGRSMLERLASRPWAVVGMARLLAELHAAMHGRRAPDLPSLRQRLASKIREAEPLPAELKQRALAALERLPDDDALCHGDFHPDNVLLTPGGPVIIDWPDATHGHPLADVARTQLLMQAPGLPPGTARRWLLQALRELFHAVYLRHYLKLRPASRRQLVAWQLPVAAARLSEDIPQEREWVLALVKGHVT